MNPRPELLRLFRAGYSPQEVTKKTGVSSKTSYRYFKLHLVLSIKRELQFIADSDLWPDLNSPRLKVLLKEVKRWQLR